MRPFTHITKPAVLAVSIAAVTLALAACDRRKEGNAGDMSPATGISNPTTSENPPATTTPMPASASTVTDTGTMPAAASTMASTGAALSSADTAFLTEVTRSNEAEIATTQLGMDQGNAKNKALSKTLHDDHVALRPKVMALMPNAPETTAAAPAELAGLTGDAFDKKLLDVYTTQHEGAIRKFSDASANPALSEPVRTLAKDTLPKLQAHLQAVKDAKGG